MRRRRLRSASGGLFTPSRSLFPGSRRHCTACTGRFSCCSSQASSSLRSTFAWKVGQGIEKSHLQSTESGMIDLALVLAQDFGEPDAMPHMGDALQISREVFGDPSLDLRVVCFDRKGFIIYDTAGTWVVGTKPESGSDVSKALREATAHAGSTINTGAPSSCTARCRCIATVRWSVRSASSSRHRT